VLCGAVGGETGHGGVRPTLFIPCSSRKMDGGPVMGAPCSGGGCGGGGPADR
jgi:hypothetical protein